MLVSRVLSAAESAEITCLLAAHKANIRLINALHRVEAYNFHKHTMLSKVHEDLWPQNREELRHEVGTISPKDRLNSTQAMFGVLSEVDRYIH